MSPSGKKVYLIDDDPAIRNSLGLFLENSGYAVAPIATARELLDRRRNETGAVVVLDHFLADMTGLELQAELKKRDIEWPVIFLSGGGNIQLSVKAMKAGAVDFLEKPVSNEQLLASVKAAFKKLRELERSRRLKRAALERSGNLSDREREIMQYLVAGMSNNMIAEHLGLSTRTVEVHRANIKRKMAANSLVELVRLSDMC